MLRRIIALSQFCFHHNLTKTGHLVEWIMMFIFGAHISGKAIVPKSTKISHGGLGVIINGYTKLGENVIINPNVVIGHGFPHGGAPTIGNNVYIGANSFLGGGITISDNVIIGANSVLTKDVKESGVVVAGNPAKVLRKLSPEELDLLK